MLGIIVALPAECHTLTGQRSQIGRWVWLTPTIRVQVAGMGAARAVAAAEDLFRAGACAILSWGVAAALEPEAAAGTLLLPRRLVLPDRSEAMADARWWSDLRQVLTDSLAVIASPLAGSDAILATPVHKRALFDVTGAAAADMESAFLARWANERGVPFAALRAISDTATTEIPAAVLAANDGQGMVSLPRLLARLLRHPGQLAGLIALGRQFSAACAQLKRAAARLGAQRFCLP